MKGELRREMIGDIVSGRAAERAPDEATREMVCEVQPDLLPDELDDPNVLGVLHPWFMGGEHLPEYLPGELEIARLVLQSTTMDVVSIRARPDGDLIRYRVVDEYPEIGPFAVLEGPRTSTQPLTFGEMVDLIDAIAPNPQAWGRLLDRLGCDSYVECLREKTALPPCNLEHLERAARFVTVRSLLYAQLEPFFEERAREWLDRKKADLRG